MAALVKTERFPLSQVTLSLPAYAAEHLVIAGLTAAQWRIALPLISLARKRPDQTVVVDKPRLEEMSGVMLDSTDRLLAPLLDATIDLPGDELDGKKVFDSIAYERGVRGKSHGRLQAQLSIGMGHFLARGRNRTVDVPADEMRRYRSVGAIVLRMKLGAALELQKHAKRLDVRITAADVSEVFGSTYGRVAVIKRPSAATGKIVEHVSLSRAGAVLVEPAVAEINDTSRSMRVQTHVVMNGRSWASIDLRVDRLTVRPVPKTFGEMKTLPVARKIAARGGGTRTVVQNA